MGIIVLPQLVAGAVIGTNCYAMTVGNSKMHVVSFATPAVLAELATYDLNAAAFAVDQKDPSAIVSYPTTNRLYVQNASEGLPANMIFAVYNATNPLAVAQQGTINFGANLFIGANGGNALAIAHPVVYSLLGGDISATPAQLNSISVTNPAAPAILDTVLIGTFSDKPRKLFLDGNTLYVLSGTPSVANQTVFVYNVSDPSNITLTGSIDVNNAATLVGVRNFFIADDTISIIAGTGTSGNVNLVIFSLAGTFLGSALVTTGVAGTAIAQAA